LFMGKLSAKWPRNAWTRNKNVNGARRLSKFGIYLARSKLFPYAIGNHGRNLVI
jgi:hypothetical protein